MMLLVLSLVLFFCSLLIFMDLSHPFFWKVSLGATEYGHLFFLMPVVIALAACAATPLALTTTIISILTIAVLFVPSVFAARISRTLPQKLNAVFGPASQFTKTHLPFRWTLLWFDPEFTDIRKETLLYARHGGIDLRLHFFRASSSGPAPCIIVFHTGGWDSGSPDEFEQMNQYLASKGYAVASVAYRLTPQFQWPAQQEDALAAIAYLRDHADELSIDPQQFVLFGRSAGGQIAEIIAYTSNNPSIKGCIGFYAPADLIFAHEHLSPEPDILDSRRLLYQLLGGPLSERHDVYHHASSFHHVAASVPPTLLVHGAMDPLTWYRQSERLSEQLTAHGVVNAYVEIPCGTHAFDYNFNGPGGQISRYAVEYFLSTIVPSVQ